ncbi:MAG: DUF2961 domain-containing protein [Polyangiaceae bacterium]|nr:DUF2961 domain-containing protein [Polyangiaceae bacterium]
MAALIYSVARPTPTRLAVPTPDLPEGPSEIGVQALLSEMLDLTRLSELPEPAFAARLASSYDRRSVSRADSEGWFANNDWASRTDANYVATEERDGREETVLLDLTGPGAIVRIWSATPAGILRIYLDGSALPVLAEPMESLLSGAGPLPPPIAHVTARGYNLYFPFPFRQSCRVTVDDLVATDDQGRPFERFYYQINYRQYEARGASRIRSYRPSDLKRAAPLIRRLREVLDGEQSAVQPGAGYRTMPLETGSDEAQADVRLEGGGLIRQLNVRLADTRPEALEATTIELSFDGERTVAMPLGEFVGSGSTLTPYRSLLFETTGNGDVMSRWPMPFRAEARIVVRGQPNLSGELGVEPRPFSERSLYFHAVSQPPTRVSTRPFRDLTFLDATGSGQYVGSALRFDNPPGIRWWGEGDEKIYVDGAVFPTQFGTGTEDYYGYAWSTPERFQSALHGQPRAGTGGFDGSFFMYRMHLLDAVPFQTSLRFDLELWHWDETEVTWASTAYYYARPAGAS